MQRDAAYLRDILEAARLALAYLQKVDREAFDRDTKLQDAVLRRLEIIGEAARRVSADTRRAHPEIPWRQMIGMRNQVIHMYDGVDMNVVLGHRPGRPARLARGVAENRRIAGGLRPHSAMRIASPRKGPSHERERAQATWRSFVRTRHSWNRGLQFCCTIPSRPLVCGAP